MHLGKLDERIGLFGGAAAFITLAACAAAETPEARALENIWGPTLTSPIAAAGGRK